MIDPLPQKFAENHRMDVLAGYISVHMLTRKTQKVLMPFTTMDNRLAIPIIAGLAASLVIALGFAFDPSRVVDSDTSTGHTRDGSLRIWIGGMKDRYSVNEAIDFTFHAKGHSYFCSGPTAKILNADSGELAHDIPQLDVHILCLPDTKDIDITIPLEEIMSPYTPILLEPGRYALVVEFEGVMLDKQFIVSDD